jgi:hypothetical protein
MSDFKRVVSLPLPGDLANYEVTNRDDPRSIINLVPEVIQTAIEQVPDWLLAMDPRELRDHFRNKAKAEREERLKQGLDGAATESWQPSFTDDRLRLSFWNEYEASQALKRPMQMTRVYAGICSRQYFYDKVITNYLRMAWLLCPPQSYAVSLEEALLFGIDQMRDILTIPHVDSRGKVDPKIAKVKLDIVNMLDQRVKGAVVQKTQALHVHASTDKLKSQAPIKEEDMAELDRRLKELELESAKLASPQQRQIEDPVEDAILVNTNPIKKPDIAVGHKEVSPDGAK